MKNKQIMYGRTSTWKWDGKSKKSYANTEEEKNMKGFKKFLEWMLFLIIILVISLVICGLVK